MSKVLETSGAIVTALQSLGYSPVYYTRTQYTSPDGLSYYYKYVYYEDSGHHYYVGTTYSFVYGLWA